MRAPSRPAVLSLRLADVWINNVVSELARWGHGVLSRDPHSGGVAIGGVANTRGCCCASLTVEACAGTFVSNNGPHDHTVCGASHRQVPVTVRASRTGPGATAVTHVLANNNSAGGWTGPRTSPDAPARGSAPR